MSDYIQFVSLGTAVLSAICQIFLVLLWAQPHSLEVRNGCVMCFGWWNMSGSVMGLFQVKASRASWAPLHWLCPAGCRGGAFLGPVGVWGLQSVVPQPTCLHKPQERDLKRCSLLRHLPVYLDFSSCRNYRFIRNCKNSTERSLVSFTQFSPRVLSYISIKCYFKSLGFGGYLSVRYSILINRNVFLFPNMYFNCRDMKLFQTYHILIPPL